jgi:hypothetical protein
MNRFFAAPILLLVLVIAILSTTAFVRATNESSYQYGYSAGRNIAQEGKDYELGLQCSSSSVVNPEVTNVSACGDGYRDGYDHFVSKRWEQRTSSEDLFSYQQGWKTGTHDYDCAYYGGQQSSSIMGNGVHNCSNTIQNVCNIDYKLNTTNATSCFNGYVDSWHKFCTFNSTSCSATLNSQLAGHSMTYWAGWENGKADGEGGKFDIGGSMPANTTLKEQSIWYSGYYNGYNKYCNKGGGNDNCPAIKISEALRLIPSQEESLSYDIGFSDGFIGKNRNVPGPPYTQNYTRGYEAGSVAYQEIKGAIIPGYTGKPMIRPSHLLDKNETSDYLNWYQQAKHLHIDDKFTISIPSHTDDNYLAYYEGIQDGMLVYDQDNNRENGNTNPPLGHSYQHEYNAGFNDGWNIEHEAEDAD